LFVGGLVPAPDSSPLQKKLAMLYGFVLVICSRVRWAKFLTISDFVWFFVLDL